VRAATRFCGALLCALGMLAAPAYGQEQPPEEQAPAAESAIERYLEERDLTELLAVYLLEQLKTADAGTRLKLADRLGSLYTALLDKAATQDQREAWEKRSQDLLAAVPEADSFELRLNLAKARYLRAEDLAERARLQLVTPEERQEAERTLRSAGAVFTDIGTKLSRKVDVLEKREGSGPEQDVPAVRQELADARRLRSLAMYYAGWSSYYVGLLSNKAQPAEEALTSFGYLLNAPGRQANVERVPDGLLAYEHVARAAIGSALAESLRGRDGPAILWLETLERTQDVPEGVRKQLFARRIWVLGAGKRWADLAFAVERRRQPSRQDPVKPLDVGEARLLAVVALEALQDAGTPARAREVIQPLADTAMTDLIALGEVKHVQDLVLRYGSATLGGEGFIVQYVRGMQAYERAREAHKQTGGDLEQPSADAAAANLYRQAAGSFEQSLKSVDSANFVEERANAGLLLGLSRFYAGDLVQAADLFEEAYRRGGNVKAQEDALWLAIVALDKASLERSSLRERLRELSTLYLKQYPGSDRAAKLLLRQASSDLIAEDKAIEILMGISPGSPLYEAARRQAATLLYSVYRRARGPDRDFAALRFAEVSEEILRIDRAKLTQLKDDEARRVMEQIIVRVRQVLDAVLGMSAPDLARADKAFEVLDAIAADAGVDFQKVEDELTYRRLQLAMARADQKAMTASLDRLRAIGGRFADAADRLMYKRASTLLGASPDSPAAAEEVVSHGLRVIKQFDTGPQALSDPAVASLYNAVADAAARVWRANRDEFMRDTALKLDRAIVKIGNPPAVVLRRLAEISEAVEEVEEALECWRMLVAGLGRGDPAWFEARYHSLRLLSRLDPPKAREAMAQHKVLNPEFGPEPWGELLRALDQQIGPAPPPAAPAAPGAPSKGGPR
jgi:hypothetical protein